ncbi:MAG: hypothetical protein HKP37_11630 [Boseongicola sp.]|nr:PLDc N-terminal domain-containing protein [Boseongicola sp.]NNL19380.1 hypothetical protein [Boseongicola sp.]
MVQYLGLILLIAWAVNIWAFMSVIDMRPGISRIALWAIVLLIPVLGFVAWYLLGPRPSRR